MYKLLSGCLVRSTKNYVFLFSSLAIQPSSSWSSCHLKIMMLMKVVHVSLHSIFLPPTFKSVFFIVTSTKSFQKYLYSTDGKKGIFPRNASFFCLPSQIPEWKNIYWIFIFLAVSCHVIEGNKTQKKQEW